MTNRLPHLSTRLLVWLTGLVVALCVTVALPGCKKKPPRPPVTPYAGPTAGDAAAFHLTYDPELKLGDIPRPGLDGRGCGAVTDYRAYAHALSTRAFAACPSDAPFAKRSALGESVLAALGVRQLLCGAFHRPVTYRTLDIHEREDGIAVRVLFRDKWIGNFVAIVRGPRELSTPRPVILALHGHSQAPEGFLGDLRDMNAVRRGYIVAAPAFEAMCTGQAEHDVTQTLLDKGQSILGLRAYQTLVVLRYLHHLHAVDSRRVGLIGHSGGGTLGNVLIRLAPGAFAAYATDNTSEYRGKHKALFTDDMVPALQPLALEINDFATAGLPVLRMPYGFLDVATRQPDMERVGDFFDAHLHPLSNP
ncbi:MAG: PHB depolymerase family esterase [Candidatus Lernaella stagnicola]|nr:PHB depolymerase family esterase [Candidatus Lernaella stagnicola]